MLLSDGSVWRMRDLQAHGVARTTVRRAVEAGRVEALSRGIYRRADAPGETNADFAEVSARFARGVVCLLSAAQFHRMTDELPERVWLAVPNNTRTPTSAWPPVRLVRWRASAARNVGIETHSIQGVQVRVTSPARTVVDMLRMMTTVGEDRAMECLRDYAGRGGSVGEVRIVADSIGVADRLAPYIRMIPLMEPSNARPRRDDTIEAEDQS